MLFSTVIWFLFEVLVALNILDYATTYAALADLKKIGAVYMEAPLWKCTRLGQWLVRHGVVRPPVVKKVEWWEHELNPLGQSLLQKWGVRSLAYLKIFGMGTVGAGLTIQTLAGVEFLPPMFYTLLFANIVYILVVVNNLKVVGKCRRARVAARK